MKKTFWVFSLSMLLFSIFTPNFIYALEPEEEEAKEILSWALNEAMKWFDELHWVASILQAPNEDRSIYTESNNYNSYPDDFNPYIIHDEENWIITIYTWDFSYGITFQDKNLWANKVWDFWEYYKWWYNYPIILAEHDYTMYGNQNSWWWGSDNKDNNYWYDKINHRVTNASGRRWPCPEWYHVPSRWEWEELVKIYNIIKTNNWIFYEDLMLPRAWHVTNVWTIQWKNDVGCYHSSSYANQDFWDYHYYKTQIWKNYIDAARDTNIAQHWESVRCFKNDYENNQEPKEITYHPNWWAFSWKIKDETITYTYYYNWEKLKPFYNIQIPNKESDDDQQSWWMFAWWYTTPWNWETQNEEFDPNNTNTNVAYAKWLPFNDLNIKLWNFELTLMDRNLWAKSVASWTYYWYNNWNEADDKLWFYYQRWNNYWFNIFSWIKTSEKKVSAQYYWPNNYFYNNIFILTTNDSVYDWSTIRNPNLWWWKNWSNTDYEKQWPCPLWYHVPNSNEWNVIYNEITTNSSSKCYWKTEKIWECIASSLKLPYAWKISWIIWSNSPKLYFAWEEGYYWSVTPDPQSTRSKFFYLSSYNAEPSAVQYWYTHWRNSWFSVRCIKNNSKTNKLKFVVDNELYNTKEALWREPINESFIPEEPIKENAKFIWWKLENSNNLFEFTDNNYISEDTTLIAKFSCDVWYSMSKDWLNCIKIWITYNANWWKFISWETEKRIISTLREIPSIWKIAHTPNYKDDGEYITEYEWQQVTNDYNWVVWKFWYDKVFYYKAQENITDVIDIEDYNEKDLFEINLKYWYAFWSYCTKIAIWTWNHPEYNYSNNSNTAIFSDNISYTYTEFETGLDVESNVITISFYNTCPSLWYYLNFSKKTRYEIEFDSNQLNSVWVPIRQWHEFLWWYEENSEIPFDFKNTSITEDRTLYAHWKSLEKKSEEKVAENVVYTNNTTVTVWEETTEEALSWSTTLSLVAEEVKQQEVTKKEDKTTVKETEIKVTSDKKVEYEWWLEVYLEKTETVGTDIVTTGKVEWTIKFSAPIAVKIPVASEAEYVKVQVKHWNEEFWFKWLTLNPVNECYNWEAVNDNYNWEDVEVKGNNWERYATIYTCSASIFVAYTESTKSIIPQSSRWIWRPINQEVKVTEEEHNSAATEEVLVEETSKNSKVNESVEQKVKKIEWKTLTRWEVAVMTNILLDVYPKLTENKSINEVSKACENYADEQDFTKDEKKAITRLCKLSIMWIHNDNNEPLEEFLVKQKASNWEFAIVMNRVVSSYNEKDLSTIKEVLKKLENDDEGVVFGTVYNVFMSIKNIFN